MYIVFFFKKSKLFSWPIPFFWEKLTQKKKIDCGLKISKGMLLIQLRQ